MEITQVQVLADVYFWQTCVSHILQQSSDDNNKRWKVTKSRVLLAKMIKLRDKSRCLKVHGKTRVLVMKVK
jgi:hypothetical protein